MPSNSKHICTVCSLLLQLLGLVFIATGCSAQPAIGASTSGAPPTFDFPITAPPLTATSGAESSQLTIAPSTAPATPTSSAVPHQFIAPVPSETSSGDVGTGGCSKSVVFSGAVLRFSRCDSLGSVQGASLAWTLRDSNNTLDVLFSGVATSPTGWVGWGINPGPAPAMSGTQAFIAFQAPNGTTLLTYDVRRGRPLRSSPIDVEVLDSRVQISGGINVAILVSLRLKPNQSTVLNHVWARGDSVADFQPAMHGRTSEELSGLRRIDMAASSGSSSAVGPLNQRLKSAHGILNVLAWDIVLALGAMEPRYIRLFLPGSGAAWFKAHRTLQCVGFGIALPGIITGMMAGKGTGPAQHRCVGITLFLALCVQVIFAIFRPDKNAGIRRTVWVVSHRILAIGMLAMGWTNTFSGLRMLAPHASLRRAALAMLPALASLSLALELLHWITRRFRNANMQQSPDAATSTC